MVHGSLVIGNWLLVIGYWLLVIHRMPYGIDDLEFTNLGLFSAGGTKRRPSIIGRMCAFESKFGVILTGLAEIRACQKRR